MIYNILSLLPFMVCLFWTAVLVLERGTRNAARPILTTFMGTSTLLYLCHAAFFTNQTEALPVANHVYAFCTLAVFPLYSLYIERLTMARPLNTAKILCFLLPAMAGCVLGNGLFTKIVFFLELFPVCWCGFRRLHDFDRKIENFYSDTELRSVKQTRRLMLVLVICSFCSAAANFIGRDYFFFNPHLLFVPSLVFSTLLFSVGYVGMRQRYCADELERESSECEEQEEAVEEEDGGEDAAKAKLTETDRIAMLDQIMSDERLYLQPDLRLSELALRMNICRSNLSSLINRSKGVSFSEYINSLRISHAQEIMRDEQTRQLSIIQLCELCGFSNERSFYRAFVKVTGMTPRQWVRCNKNS